MATRAEEGNNWCQFIFLAVPRGGGYDSLHGTTSAAIDDGLVYHALNRGNNRNDVFADEPTIWPFSRPSLSPRKRHPCTTRFASSATAS